ncbi:flavodoxin/nitric oxide synthase [Bifidobacterium saguini DSM 23967]|uniref:Flavodoxin/nitric oxide synthase n=2 Tax=Bifidobacterium saguini TaxID=762210 RepID=A0A087D9X2_9BIFI|nr:flavodoxin [Bifidobacterium saguini]KFI92322.1 flavodoxin/nitric oxide synthase [Bifidobacterium saguini DSM 23967]QTB91022.1 flavodoxin [Bifidobacterium saguini]
MPTATRARIIAALSTIMLTLLPLLAGCTSSNSTQTNNTTAAPQSSSGNSNDTSGNGDLGKVLIAYYSFSGNTENVAEKVHERFPDADMFKIEPAESYGNYSEAAARAEKEHDENARPAVTNHVENMDQYDTILLGYPIWWGTAPMFIATFLESYDFDGKTIYPFCTSSYTPIEDSYDLLRKAAPNATIGDGLTANSNDATNQWLNKLTSETAR